MEARQHNSAREQAEEEAWQDLEAYRGVSR
jgi:hypothetical protein